MQITKKAQQLSERLNVQVEADAFDVGYWMRIAREPLPRSAGDRLMAGWYQADRELEAEKRET